MDPAASLWVSSTFLFFRAINALRSLRPVGVQLFLLGLLEEPLDLLPHESGTFSLLDGAHPDDDQLLLQAELLDLQLQLVADRQPEEVGKPDAVQGGDERRGDGPAQ